MTGLDVIQDEAIHIMMHHRIKPYLLLLWLLLAAQHVASQTLPRIDIDSLSGTISEETPVDATFTISYLDSATNALHQETYACRVNHRGATSMLYDKKSLEVAFIEAGTGDDLEVNLLGIREGLDKYILDATASDRSHLRNRVAMDLFGRFARLPYATDYDRRYSTVGRFVEVWIEGEYEGLFCLSDRVNRKLMGCKKPQNGVVSGVLYKCGSYDDGAFLISDGTTPDTSSTEWNSWSMKYPNEVSAAAWQPLQQLMDAPWDEVPDSDYAGLVEEHFYWDNLVDVYLFTIALAIGDMGYKNCYLACPNTVADSRFVVVLWDLDHSFGSTWNAAYMNTPVTLRGQSNLWRVHPYKRLMEDDGTGFKAALAERWYELRDSVLSVENVTAVVQGYATLLDSTQGWQHDREKWDGNPIAFYPSAQQEAAYMIAWYSQAHQRLSELLAPYLPVPTQQSQSKQKKQ